MKRIIFSYRETPSGCTVEVLWSSGRKQVKRFRNGYAHSTASAKKWVEQQIAHIKPAAKVNAAIANQRHRRLVSMCCYAAIEART